MKNIRIFTSLICISFLLSGCGSHLLIKDSLPVIEKVNQSSKLKAELISKIKLPKGYHEGILVGDKTVMVNNGYKIDTWVIDIDSGKVIEKIKPPGTFSEGITKGDDGFYYVSDWDKKSLYKCKLEDGHFVVFDSLSLAPSHPTGVTWHDGELLVITWTRGMGTKYHLLRIDKNKKIINRYIVSDIREPSQICSDGEDIWISSWYENKIYKIALRQERIIAEIKLKISKITGIYVKDKVLWVTGTYADLYRYEIMD